MRILCVIQRFHPVIGGSEVLAKNLMDHLSKNHSVTIFTTTANDIQSFWNKDISRIVNYSDYENYEIKRYDFLIPSEIKFDPESKFFFDRDHPGPFSLTLWSDLVCNKIDFDLIIIVGFPHDHIIPAYVAAKKWKLPLITIPLIHQEFPELYLTALRLTILNNSDRVFVMSESEKKKLVTLGIDQEKISRIYPPINLDEWKNSHQENFKELISMNNKKIILFAGSKSYVKGAIFLIEAMKKVWIKEPEIVLMFIGSSTKEFREYSLKLPKNIKEKIIDLDIVNDNARKNVFNICNLLVLPSKSESFGLVYLEAWMCEKPVIGCTIESTIELIDHMKNGLLVEFGNVNQLSDSILSLIQNPSLCEKLGKEGKQKSFLFDSKIILSHFEAECLLVVKNFKNNIPE